MRNEDMQKVRKKYKEKLSPLKSIKAYCKEQCCAGNQDSWKSCTFWDCFLFRYRLGRLNKDLSKIHWDNPIILEK